MRPVASRSGWALASAAGCLALLGCVQAQFTTLTIYETPHAFVRLETHRGVAEDGPLAHPATISPERMAAVLRGIIVEEPLTRLPLYDDLSIPRRHPAFDEEDVALLAPLLSVAIGTATSEEIVTFYRSRRLSGVRREVTSGGLFVQGNELHILLSNNRSETHAAADIGVADTTDDRLTPLRSLAPQKGTLRFEPVQFQRTTDPHGLGRLFHWDRRELIVRMDRLLAAPPSGESSTPR